MSDWNQMPCTSDPTVSGNYTLTMVRDLYLIRYEGQYKFVQREESKDGKGTETSRTELTYTETFKYTDTKFDFDLYDTDSYTLNVYGDLYLSHFYENKVLYNKLAELYKSTLPMQKQSLFPISISLGANPTVTQRFITL